MAVTALDSIHGLQSISRYSNDKYVAAILVELIEANEESFVIVLQHGGNDIERNRLLNLPHIAVIRLNYTGIYNCLE